MEGTDRALERKKNDLLRLLACKVIIKLYNP